MRRNSGRRRHSRKMTDLGLAETLGPRSPDRRVLRMLWRMRGPTPVIVARIERHPFGRELVIAFEDRDHGVIEMQFAPSGIEALEQRAEEVRVRLVARRLGRPLTAEPLKHSGLPRPACYQPVASSKTRCRRCSCSCARRAAIGGAPRSRGHRRTDKDQVSRGRSRRLPPAIFHAAENPV